MREFLPQKEHRHKEVPRSGEGFAQKARTGRCGAFVKDSQESALVPVRWDGRGGCRNRVVLDIGM